MTEETTLKDRRQRRILRYTALGLALSAVPLLVAALSPPMTMPWLSGYAVGVAALLTTAIAFWDSWRIEPAVFAFGGDTVTLPSPVTVSFNRGWDWTGIHFAPGSQVPAADLKGVVFYVDGAKRGRPAPKTEEAAVATTRALEVEFLLHGAPQKLLLSARSFKGADFVEFRRWLEVHGVETAMETQIRKPGQMRFPWSRG